MALFCNQFHNNVPYIHKYKHTYWDRYTGLHFHKIFCTLVLGTVLQHSLDDNYRWSYDTIHHLNIEHCILEMKWYFVTKIVLTYCEKKLF